MQELFLVMGGELVELSSNEFRDPNQIHIVGIFHNRSAAGDAWKAAAWSTVDNALMRYFIVPISRVMDVSLRS
jgi:hypothetical protein